MARSFVDLVNPLQGSLSAPQFGTAPILPLIKHPDSPEAWTLVNAGPLVVFDPGCPRLWSLRCLPLGLDIGPQTGPVALDPHQRASAFRLDRSLVSPHRLRTEFLRYRVTVDLVPGRGRTRFRTTWGEGGTSRLVFQWPRGSLGFDAGSQTLQPREGEGEPWHVEFSRPVARWEARDSWAWVEFDLPRGASVEMEVVGASALDPTAPFDQAAEASARGWDALLQRIEVEGGTDDQRRSFYSCLYRTLCGRLDEAEAPRAVAPLWALVYPEKFLEALPTARGPALWAEAVSHGLAGDEVRRAWPSLVEAAVPSEASKVSATLDRAYQDWCLAQIAGALGDESARIWGDRSVRWQSAFDPSMGFFRPREPGGDWAEGFNPLAWGGAFAQGSAWQEGWAVPHDPEGLIAALGGPEVALARLDTLFALKPLFQLGDFDRETPDMTLMATSDFGQYAHGLPVTHGIPWHYALAGRPDKTERWTRRVLAEAYGPGPGGLRGNFAADAAAWYVWAALGLYPLCPGTGQYVLGSPLFPRVTLRSGPRTLVIEAPETSTQNTVVRRRTLGNVVLSAPRVSRADLFDLGRLVCEMVESVP